MELEIDAALVDAIAADEMQQARAELAALGPVAALALSQRRHDMRLEHAADAPALACKAGCYWCCYFTVDVRAVEVMRIVEVMQNEMSHANRVRIEREIRTNNAALAGLDPNARLRQNVKCPFLYLGRCSIYGARPQTCRNYHATNSAGCKRAYQEPENDEIDPEFAPLVYQSGGAHVEAFSAVLKEAGYDVAAYELNAALAVALADPAAARTRFEAKQPAFPTIEGTEVLPELLDA